MEIHKNDYILGSWYAERDNGDNWLMTIVKRGDVWLGEYRFRYKKDTKVFNSNDKKSFYSFRVKGKMPEDMVIRAMNELFEILKLRYSKRNKFIEVKGDMDKWIYLLAQEDIMHIKTISLKPKKNCNPS